MKKSNKIMKKGRSLLLMNKIKNNLKYFRNFFFFFFLIFQIISSLKNKIKRNIIFSQTNIILMEKALFHRLNLFVIDIESSTFLNIPQKDDKKLV